MRAVPLPFFKERLKEVSRELEKTLDLTRVKNERDGPVLAPTRNEFEQARRLGVDIQSGAANDPRLLRSVRTTDAASKPPLPNTGWCSPRVTGETSSLSIMRAECMHSVSAFSV